MGRAFQRWVIGATLAIALAGCREPATAEWVERLSSDRESTRVKAEAALVAKPADETWSPLIALLEDSSRPAHARVAAIRVLAATSTHRRRLPPAVASALRDADEAVRAHALEAIVKSGAPAFASPLDALRVESGPASAAASAAWPRYLDARRAWYREELATATMSEERALAARALGDEGKGDDVRALLAALEREDSALVRAELISALGALGGDGAREAVRREILSPDAGVRSVASLAAGSLRDPDAVPLLDVLLTEDPDPDVRVAAIRALRSIGTPPALAVASTRCRAADSPRLKAACAEL